MQHSLFTFFFFSTFPCPLLMEDISYYIVLLNYPPPTLVHHLNHYLSSCPINFLFQLFWMIIFLETLFRCLLYINAAIMVGTVHLIWRLQHFYRYFGVFLPPSISVRCSYMVGTSWSTLIMVRVSNWIVFNRFKEEYLLEKLSCYFPDPKF